MIRKWGISLVGVTFLLMSCNTEEQSDIISDIVSNDTTVVTTIVEDTAQLMINNCYSCHNPNMTGEAKIAPDLAQIKKMYLENNTSQEEFKTFVASPNVENAIMKNAVDKYGIMPNMQFPQEDIEKITAYIFSNSIETETWLAINYNGDVNEPTFEDGDYLGLGRHISISTKKVLGKNLKSTIKNKGTLEAVKYCNVRALPITDSMATFYNTTITRISNKERNPANIASPQEVKYIFNYQEQLDNELELNPILDETDDLATFYMPIVTNDMCLQCHGGSQDIETPVATEIANLYPTDKATGYDINQIRGLWKIEIRK